MPKILSSSLQVTKTPYRVTKRLIIRPLTQNDYFAWKTAYSSDNPPKNKWDQFRRPLSELILSKFNALLKKQKKRRAEDHFFDFGIFLKEPKGTKENTRKNRKGSLIGVCSIMDISRGLFQSAYLGYGISNRHWKKGYGKEAIIATFDIAFKDLKLHRIEAGIDPHNRRSILLARSLKMRHEGNKRQAIFLRGKWSDSLIYLIRCDELRIKFHGPSLKSN